MTHEQQQWITNLAPAHARIPGQSSRDREPDEREVKKPTKAGKGAGREEAVAIVATRRIKGARSGAEVPDR